jgi:hypothetical protein
MRVDAKAAAGDPATESPALQVEKARGALEIGESIGLISSEPLELRNSAREAIWNLSVSMNCGYPEAPTAPSKASPAPLLVRPGSRRSHLDLDHPANFAWGRCHLP